MIEWAILALVMYVIGGTLAARQAYIIKQIEYLAIADDENLRAERMDEIRRELRNLPHGICNMNYSSMKHRGCDCSKKKKWHKLHEELDSLESGGPIASPPPPQYAVVATWPLVAWHYFITPKVVPSEVVEQQNDAGAIGYPADEYAKVLVNPWENFIRHDDTVSQTIKRTWAEIHAKAKSELEKVRKNDPDAFIQEYEDKHVVFDGEGNVVKTFDFEAEPILIGKGNSPRPKEITPF